MDRPPTSTLRAWRWVPTLYFAQGIPYVAVMTLSVVMYKNLGISNADIALYTSWLYLPWVIKPVWSPVVDLLGRKRLWVVATQFVLGATLAGVALTLPGPGFFRMTLAVFWLMAFSSATHDIAADGFYMLALDSHEQAAFVGVRSTCYRLAMIAGQGGLVYLAGTLQERTGNVVQSWVWVFFVLAGVFLAAALYHRWILPRPESDRARVADGGLWTGFRTVFSAFFRRPGVGVTLAFLLLYRLAEAQLLKLVVPFLLDDRAHGGLGLSTKEVGIVYGTVGTTALLVGGLLGGYMISRWGLRRMLWPMILIMHVPDVIFVLLAATQPASVPLIGVALAAEQFGYGFGFTAYLLYMILVSEGEYKTAHYALCTGFMALGMMVPGWYAGWIQEHLGYHKFFLWVILCTVPSFIAAALITIDPAFGRKKSEP